MGNLYIQTVQIVGGILTPIIVAALIFAIGNYAKYITEVISKRREELKQNPPFEVRLYEVPNPKMLGVEISKDGDVIADIGVDKL